MGFNIGVFSKQVENNPDCDVFIGRAFYNFVNSAEMYGDQSILIQSGIYYGLDLSPLLKLVYTWDEVTEEYIKSNVQNTDFLLSLVTNFQAKIFGDKLVCDKIKYVWYESFADMTEDDIQKLIAEVGKEAANPYIEMIKERKKDFEDNPNPWKWYFEDGQILKDLNDLITSIKCFKGKGATEIYLTAG